MTLNARFLTETLLEVKESLLSANHTKVNWWYYDLSTNLCSYTGCEGDAPTRPMTKEQRAWVDKHLIPLAHRQADEAYIAAQRQATADAQRKKAEDYCRRIEELDARSRRWEAANPILDASHEELNRMELEHDALRDFWKRELRVYNYRNCPAGVENPLTIHNVSRKEAIKLITTTRPLRSVEDFSGVPNHRLVESALLNQFLLLNIHTPCPVTGHVTGESDLTVFRSKLRREVAQSDEVMDWIGLALKLGHESKKQGRFYALAV